METSIYITGIVGVIGALSSIYFHSIGYRKGWEDGSRRVVEEWRTWNDQVFGEGDE